MNRGVFFAIGMSLLALLVGLGPVEQTRAVDAFRPLLETGNGDGYADLVVGVPGEDWFSDDEGVVHVLYANESGIPTGDAGDFWREGGNGLSGTMEMWDGFGTAVATGDFNGDYHTDLAIGIPGQSVGGNANAGAVHVIYASPDGLTSTGDTVFTQDDLFATAEPNDAFGQEMVVGDFNGDGYDDLAIGIPEEDVGAVVDAGAVQVMYGTADGLTGIGDQLWTQEGAAETGDLYGSTLATGDFDNDGYDDLAVGIPSEDLVSVLNTGAVDIYYGSSSGLIVRVSNDFWHQDRTGVADTAEENDLFGFALTAGDFNGDGYDDLGVGVPYEDAGSPVVANAGAVNVLHGSSSGITGSGSDFWHQDASGIGSLNEEDDRFGFALTAGDFDGDGYTDLAVGVPYEHWNLEDTGIVQVLYGTTGGLSAVGDQIWRQDITGIAGTEETGDRFGYALAAGDFDGNGYVDLAIGVPYESVGSEDQAGAVNVIYGSDMGLTATGDQMWWQGDDGLQGVAETGDRFGYALAALPLPAHTIHLPLVLRD
jgi:hypothetical protein